MQKILNEHRDNAIAELTKFIINTSILLEQAGWSWFIETDRAITEKFRPELALVRRIPLTTDGCEHTIYSPTVNLLGRFWHDVIHLNLGLGYSLEEEYQVIRAQIRSLQDAGLSGLAQEIFWADMYGQACYYHANGEFVTYQDAFVNSCLQRGITTACICKH